MTGRRADVLKAAWYASEAAMRLVKAGNKNWAVTDTVGKVAGTWGCKPVEGEYGVFPFDLIGPFFERSWGVERAD